jgi:hypothetical protein
MKGHVTNYSRQRNSTWPQQLRRQLSEIKMVSISCERLQCEVKVSWSQYRANYFSAKSGDYMVSISRERLLCEVGVTWSQYRANDFSVKRSSTSLHTRHQGKDSLRKHVMKSTQQGGPPSASTAIWLGNVTKNEVFRTEASRSA